MVVGITGGIGSGKSTIVKMFATHQNIAVYIADSEAKKMMNTSKIIKENLIKQFGKKTYEKNILNRKYLATIVFTDKEKLAVLNNIVHPEVHKHFKAFCVKNKEKDYILYENAILFENNSNVLCNKIITVFTDEQIRTQRVMQRDNVSEIEVKNRMNNQWKDAKKVLLSNYVVKNNSSLEEAHLQVNKIHNILTKSST